ncbi:MAG TPA: ribonuclease T2 [Rhodanobacteraceae bacterium]|nr:ribonuclease T2 [Rhodanobacteraceae bacterium]
MRVRLSLILAAVLAACAASSTVEAKSGSKSSSKSHHAGPKGPSQSGEKGVFDYYVMALSWSPSFCQTHPDAEDQCKNKGYGFVLHGLWPQYDGGGGPENCATTDEVDKKTIEHTLAFMPSRSLITHEWRTHGACAGMSPEDYFALADRAFAAVHVPADLNAPAKPVETNLDSLRAAFRNANPGLTDEMMSLHCSRGELVEVRVCLDKNVTPQACGNRMQTRCPASADITVPASR